MRLLPGRREGVGNGRGREKKKGGKIMYWNGKKWNGNENKRKENEKNGGNGSCENGKQSKRREEIKQPFPTIILQVDS